MKLLEVALQQQLSIRPEYALCIWLTNVIFICWNYNILGTYNTKVIKGCKLNHFQFLYSNYCINQIKSTCSYYHNPWIHSDINQFNPYQIWALNTPSELLQLFTVCSNTQYGLFTFVNVQKLLRRAKMHTHILVLFSSPQAWLFFVHGILEECATLCLAFSRPCWAGWLAGLGTPSRQWSVRLSPWVDCIGCPCG